MAARADANLAAAQHSLPVLAARLLAASRICAATAAFASLGVLALHGASPSWVPPEVAVTTPMVLLVTATLAVATLAAHAQPGRPAAVARDLAVSLSALWATVQLVLALTGSPPNVTDSLLGADASVVGGEVAGRAPAETSLMLVLLALATAAVTRPRWTARAAQPAALAAASVCTAALVGYSFGVERTSVDVSFPLFGMAAHTAVAGLLVAVAVLLARPRAGALALLTDSSPSGSLARRLVSVVVALPLALSVFTISMSRWVGNPELVLSLVVVAEVALLGVLMLVPLVALRRSDELLAAADESAVRAAEAVAEVEPLMGALTDYLAVEVSPRPGLATSVWAAPAFGTLSGDWCGLVDVDPDPADPDAHVVNFALVDVAGHGSLAAFFAARLKHQLVTSLREGLGPATTLARLERDFTGTDQIATALVCRIDLHTGAARLASAGHLPAFVAHRGTLTSLGATGPLLGAAARTGREHAFTLHRGDVFVAYTDGLTEARDATRSEWGIEHLADLVLARAAEGPAAVTEAVADAAMAHSGGRLDDDATVVALARS